MTEPVSVGCEVCDSKLRLPRNERGAVTCPVCQTRLIIDTRSSDDDSLYDELDEQCDAAEDHQIDGRLETALSIFEEIVDRNHRSSFEAD